MLPAPADRAAEGPCCPKPGRSGSMEAAETCSRNSAGGEDGGDRALEKLAGAPHWLLTMTLWRGWYLRVRRHQNCSGYITFKFGMQGRPMQAFEKLFKRDLARTRNHSRTL